jgi:hypothetical protein
MPKAGLEAHAEAAVGLVEGRGAAEDYKALGVRARNGPGAGRTFPEARPARVAGGKFTFGHARGRRLARIGEVVDALGRQRDGQVVAGQQLGGQHERRTRCLVSRSRIRHAGTVLGVCVKTTLRWLTREGVCVG